MENSSERIERLLAMILLKNMEKSSSEEKTKTLNKVGFTNVEVAELLNIKPQVVANILYISKKRAKK